MAASIDLISSIFLSNKLKLLLLIRLETQPTLFEDTGLIQLRQEKLEALAPEIKKLFVPLWKSFEALKSSEFVTTEFGATIEQHPAIYLLQSVTAFDPLAIESAFLHTIQAMACAHSIPNTDT